MKYGKMTVGADAAQATLQMPPTVHKMAIIFKTLFPILAKV